MSSRRLDQDKYFYFGHASSRRIQDVFKMSSKCLVKTSSRLVKTSSKRLQDVFKTSSRRTTENKNVLLTRSRHLQDISKAITQGKLILLRGHQQAFKMYCISTKRLTLATTPEEFMILVKIF